MIAQKFIPTEYDWRVGVLGGQPLFAVHYLMAKKHWQIVNHKANGKPDQGGIKTFTLKEAPAHVVETAVQARRAASATGSTASTSRRPRTASSSSRSTTTPTSTMAGRIPAKRTRSGCG